MGRGGTGAEEARKPLVGKVGDLADAVAGPNDPVKEAESLDFGVGVEPVVSIGPRRRDDAVAPFPDSDDVRTQARRPGNHPDGMHPFHGVDAILSGSEGLSSFSRQNMNKKYVPGPTDPARREEEGIRRYRCLGEAPTES